MGDLSDALLTETKKNKGAMAFRDDQKKQRAKISGELIDGALQLSAEEGYASLSLRSVARRAGIAPTSFYRHFRDMDELGLAIADKARDVLKECLIQAAKEMSYAPPGPDAGLDEKKNAVEAIVRPFVEVFFDYVSSNPNLFRLFFQERTGSAEILRDAINRQLDSASSYLAEQLENLGLKLEDGFENAFWVAGAMMTLTTCGAMNMLTRQGMAEKRASEQVVRECVFLLLGASMS